MTELIVNLDNQGFVAESTECDAGQGRSCHTRGTS
jgi:hypothetical protein